MMREADRRTIEELGLPGMVLMENAAQGAASVIEEAVGQAAGLDLAAFCGRGNNGGDGLAILRILANRGAVCTAYLFCKETDLSGDAAANLAVAKACEVAVVEVPDDETFEDEQGFMAGHEFYVDALLGTGLNSPVRGRYASAIELMNHTGMPILSVDIPSGLSADTGAVLGTAVQADFTATFGLMKLGLALDSGDYAGEVHLVDISIPPVVVADLDIKARLLDEESVCEALPVRPMAGHKGSFGHLLIAGGSGGMTGAVCLAVWGGIRAGAGLVTACVPEEFVPIIASQADQRHEFFLAPNRGPAAWAGKRPLRFWSSPGIRTPWCWGPVWAGTRAVSIWYVNWRAGLKCPLVLDADGLNALAGRLDSIRFRPNQIVLTPHPGEAARLLGCTVPQVQNDRPAAARTLAATNRGGCGAQGSPYGHCGARGPYLGKSDRKPAIGRRGQRRCAGRFDRGADGPGAARPGRRLLRGFCAWPGC